MSSPHVWTPQKWVTHPLPEWDPKSLPGYADALAKIARGESLFPAQPKPATAPRKRRPVESLTAERDRLTRRRDALGRTHLPDDPGALSGIRRTRTRADDRRNVSTDRELEEYTKLTRRIDYLSSRIAAFNLEGLGT